MSKTSWISVQPVSGSGTGTCSVGGGTNTGAARSGSFDVVDGSGLVRKVHVSQAAAERITVVVQDWTNTGQLCNAAGVVGAYDCDGYYTVQYYRQSRVLEDRYPDGTGGINRRTEYRVGGQATRTHVDGQCSWVRSTVVVQDWANTGQLCNAAGTVGGYDCDGTYSVQYYQQKRTLEDRYPDGSGGINRRDEYRAGSLASRQQVDGYCGYSSTHYELRPNSGWYDEYGGFQLDTREEEYIADRVYVIYSKLQYPTSNGTVVLVFNSIKRVNVDSNGGLIGESTLVNYDEVNIEFDATDTDNSIVSFEEGRYPDEYYIEFRNKDTQVPFRWNGDIWITDKNTGAKIKVMLELTN